MDVAAVGYGVLITIEGWGVNLVGCYGNALVPTPNLDAFAACGCVYDQYWMHSKSTSEVLQTIQKHGIDSSNWMIIAQQGNSDPCFGSHPGYVEVALDGGAEFECSFAELIARSLELWVSSKHQRPYLWIQAKGLAGIWDAPQEYRQVMCDEGDPEPYAGKIRPEMVFAKDYDPDERFRFAAGAGGQAICLDRGVGELSVLLEGMEMLDECFVALAGVQGYPLGEHARIGLGGGEFGEDGEGYSERLHCPMMLRIGRGESLGRREDVFIQPMGLGGMLKSLVLRAEGTQAEMIEVDLEEQPLSGKVSSALGQTVAYAVGQSELSLITSRWSGLWSFSESEDGKLELRTKGIYCHPEDRWQQNEVSGRVPEVDRIMRLIAELLLESRVDGIGELEKQSLELLERLLEELALQGR